MVLFRICGRDLSVYKRDVRIWKREASRHPGYLDCRPLFRTNEKNQCATWFVWRSESFHKRFMKKHHDRLVSLSKCPVKVLGYYNFKTP